MNGLPDVIELLYDPDYIRDGVSIVGEDNFGIYTLNEMKKVADLRRGRFLKAFSAIFWGQNPSLEEIPLSAPSSNGRAAPNISLNVAGRYVSQWELVFVTWAGLLLQVGVLVFEGLITYHLRWKKGVQDVAGYAFPLTAAGTLAISGGMFICGYVIEASTEEVEYEASFNGKRLQILWLQRSQNVSDQEFSSYAIYAAKNQQRIMTSRPLPKNRLELERLTSIGVVSTTIGKSYAR